MNQSLADALQQITILPVRHHSPAAARAVERALRQSRPRLVLIEGPSDATSLIPLLLEPDTRPPISILAYRPASDGAEPRRMVDPFCDYSPELVAMRVGRELGAEVRFFDAPALAWFDLEPAEDKGQEQLNDTPPPDLHRELADRFGFSSHEEMWDCHFEMADPAAVCELIGAYGDLVRDWFADHDRRGDLNRAREAWMVREINRGMEDGYHAEEIAVVCGAAHVQGIRAGVEAPDLIERLRKGDPARFALIPYSYPRLSEQSGYGAGNRAPAFYEEIWRRGDWNAAALGFLIRVMDAMRDQGYVVSLADAIEARRLAENLAGLRNKPSIGLEEIRDAALACYGRGTDTPSQPLWRLLIGEEVGSVTSSAARTSLQQEFMDGVKRYGIPFSDRPRDVRLNLTSPGERASSAFLHRLATAGVPFASLAATASDRRNGEGSDAFERLMVLREKWEVCWNPGTDIRLIELGVYGSSLAEVCTRLLRKRLEEARSLETAAGVLLEAALGHLDGLYDEVLAACERASSEDDDFPGVARSSYLLDVLIGYAELPGRDDLLARLSERVFTRACLLLPAAADVSNEEAARVCEGIRQLHQVGSRRRRRGEELELLVERLQSTAASTESSHPLPAGLSAAVLYLDAHLSDEELVGTLGLRLSRGEEPMKATQFVEGLFSLNRSVLVRNRAIVGSLTSFLNGLDRDAFLAVLPVLRRSLAGLSPGEMGYLVATIADALGIEAEAEEAPVLAASYLDELAGLDAEIGGLFG